MLPLHRCSDVRVDSTSNAFVTFTYPLTAGVSGAPQMTSQPVSSIFPLFSTALWDLANSSPVHSLMLSSHLFFCLPCLLLPFTVPRKMVLARSDGPETCPYRCSLLLFKMVRRSLCGPIACWIVAQTSLPVTLSLYETRSYLVLVSHFHGSYFSLQLCCESPWFSLIQEDECDKGAHQSYLGTYLNAPVIPNRV